MIQGKNFGIHISGIRDGHSSNIYSSLDNPKELESLFKDIRTAVNKIDQTHFYKVHQTPQYSIASIVTLGFTDRGGRPGAYISISLFTKKGMMFSVSPRQKLTQLISFYKEKQGNNFDSNQFTTQGLLEVVEDLKVEQNTHKATPQKVAGFALYQHESHIDKFLQFKGGALAYGHYYFLPLEAKEKMASFKTEISHLFGFEESNSRLNDLYKAAPISKPPTQSQPTNQPIQPKRQEHSKEIKKPQATVNNDNSKEPTEIRERNLSGQSLGSNSSGSGRKSSKNIRNIRNRKLIFYSIIGFVFLGIAIWLMPSGNEEDTAKPSTKAPAPPKSGALGGTKEDLLNERVKLLREGKMRCPVSDILKGDKKNIQGRLVSYNKGEWKWEINKDSGKADKPVTFSKDELNAIFAKEVAAIDKIDNLDSGKDGGNDGGRDNGSGDNGDRDNGSGDNGSGDNGGRDNGSGGDGGGDGGDDDKEKLLKEYIKQAVEIGNELNTQLEKGNFEEISEEIITDLTNRINNLKFKAEELGKNFWERFKEIEQTDTFTEYFKIQF